MFPKSWLPKATRIEVKFLVRVFFPMSFTLQAFCGPFLSFRAFCSPTRRFRMANLGKTGQNKPSHGERWCNGFVHDFKNFKTEKKY